MQTVFEDAIGQLTKKGLESRWYTVTNFDGYQAVTGNAADTVYVLEAHLGPSQISDYDTYGMAQVFSEVYPSLAIVALIERHRQTGHIAHHSPTFNIKNEDNYAGKFLPSMHTAFNPLDPTGKGYGVLVQLYHARMTLSDLVQASGYTFKLLSGFKKDNQLAQIAVDFDDPLIKVISRLSKPLAGVLAGGDSHQIARTETPSTIRIPVEDGEGGYYLIDHSSTALDEGIRLAMTYLDKHYNNKN